MEGCLSITIDRVGGIEASAERKDGGLTCSAVQPVPMVVACIRKGGLSGAARKVKQCLRFSFGLVCMTSIGGAPSGYEVLWASDGILFTIDNGYLYVRK